MNTPTTSPQEWDEDSVDFFEEPEEGIIKVGDRPVMVYCPTTYGGGDMGFYKDEWSIKAIYDRNGKRRKPVFNDDWKEIAPVSSLPVEVEPRAAATGTANKPFSSNAAPARSGSSSGMSATITTMMITQGVVRARRPPRPSLKPLRRQAEHGLPGLFGTGLRSANLAGIFFDWLVDTQIVTAPSARNRSENAPGAPKN
jgi:hypothetical protein